MDLLIRVRPVAVTVACALALLLFEFSVPAAASPAGLHVQANKLVDAFGGAVQLHGVGRSGTEYRCIQGLGIFDGPNDQASITAIKSWNTNAIRVPLNEDCWLAINGAPAAYSGATYQQAIKDFVKIGRAHV